MEKSFNEILSIILDACDKNFYSGIRDLQETALECATQIYVAQMQRGDQNAR